MKYKPDKQKILINSSDTTVFDYGTPDSRKFLGEAINSLLTIFGDDCILNGLEISEFKFLENGNIYFKISPGKVIINSTQIEYPSEIELEFNPTGYDFSKGSLIISISFKFVSIQLRNYSKFRIDFLGDNGKIFGQNTWFPDMDRLIIGYFKVDTQTFTINQYTSPILSPIILKIENKDYILRNPPVLLKQLINIVNFTVN